jgi:hypothetical protein
MGGYRRLSFISMLTDAGAIRAALLVKLHAVTGERKGYRPLGMCEKWTCLVDVA